MGIGRKWSRDYKIWVENTVRAAREVGEHLAEKRKEKEFMTAPFCSKRLCFHINSIAKCSALSEGRGQEVSESDPV